MRLLKLLLNPSLSEAEEDLERRSQSKKRGHAVDPGSSDRYERRDPGVDLGRSGSSERRDHPADPGNGQMRLDLNTNRRTLIITRSTIVMLSSQSWKPRKPSHATSTCSCN